MLDQIIILSTLFVVFILLLGEWLRYDLVAIIAMLFLTLIGLIPAADAFRGFGHPAVITVAAILVTSKGLQNAGVVSLISMGVRLVGEGYSLQLLALCAITAFTSAFMNNIGALAIMMPVAVQLAVDSNRSPSLYLMPRAFSSLLGGMTTLIGTPPNIIIATLREDLVGAPFSMFDFVPVGGAIALAGVAFLSTVGRYFLPHRKGKKGEEGLFSIESYMTELKVPKESALIGETLTAIEELTAGDIVIIGLIRKKEKVARPSRYEKVKSGDILVIESDPSALKELLHRTGFEVLADKDLGKELIGTKEIHLMEAVISPGSSLIKRVTGNLRLRARMGVSLLAVAREGVRMRQRLHAITLKIGDVLLLRGRDEDLQEVMASYALLPLAQRGLSLGIPKSLVFPIVVFGCALLCIAMNWLAIQIAFPLVAVAIVLYGLVPLRDVYRAIDWPIVVLLGAMIPVGEALESTGAAQTLANQLFQLSAYAPPEVLLGCTLLISMILTDLINNAAAAILMVPIAANLAKALEVNPDAFLMSVAIGASSAFLTPIGHQSNALVMGPGGYRFGDYWKLGLPLALVVSIVSIPLLLLVWPL